MKRTLLLLPAVALLIALLPLAAWAEYYKVRVTRKGQDIYKDENSGALIITKYCYQYVYSDNAVLSWSGRYGTNWITFSSGARCDVDDVR